MTVDPVLQDDPVSKNEPFFRVSFLRGGGGRRHIVGRNVPIINCQGTTNIVLQGQPTPSSYNDQRFETSQGNTKVDIG